MSVAPAAPSSPGVTTMRSGTTVQTEPSSPYPNFFPGWEVDVLNSGRFPVTQENVNFLDYWHASEGSVAMNNPLNTTQPEANSTIMAGGSSAGVQAYPSSAEGAYATAYTIHNGYYPNIVAALESGDPFTYLQNPSTNQSGQTNLEAVTAQLHKWGSSGFASTLNGPNALNFLSSGKPYTGSGTTTPTNPLSGIPIVGSIFGAGESTGVAAGSVVDTTSGLIKEITSGNFWIRALEMVGGFALLGLGLYLVLKDFGVPTPTLPTPANKAANELEALTFEAKRSQAQARVAEGQSRVVTAQARQEYSPRVSKARAESAETTASSAAYSAEERAKQQRARTSRERANARAARSGATEAKRRAERARATEREQIYGSQMASDNPRY